MASINRLIQAVVLALWAVVASVRSEFSNRVPGPWFHYDFLRDECLGGEITPSSVSSYNWFGNLDIVNTDTVVCRNGTGITGSPDNPQMERVLSSGASGNELLDLLHNSASGFSIEIWFRAIDHVEPDENNVILSITLMDPENEPANARNVFKLVEDGDYYKALYDFEESNILLVYFKKNLEKPASTHHFVYTVNLNYVGQPQCLNPPSGYSCEQHIAYINGIEMNTRVIWTTDESPPISPQKLHLFKDTTILPSYAPSSGTLYMLAMYGHELDEAEVLQNYQAKLTNSVPVNFDSTFIVPEDGMVGNYYDDPEYYLNPIPGSESFIIVITNYVDADEDPEHPNYNSGDSPANLVVTSLPKGDLFDFNGNPITNDDLPFAVSVSDNYKLRYRPLWNEVSGLDNLYTSFEYVYKDGVDPSLESNTATAGIYVTPRNDPPIASAGDSVVTRGLASKVCVEAYENDDGDSVAGIILSSEPQHGTLYQLDSSGTTDTETPVNVGESFDNLLCASYLYTGDSPIPPEGIMEFDTFTFKAYDTATFPAYSDETKMTLNIYEGLLAGDKTGSTKSLEVLEDTISSITLYGSDAMQIGRNITFVVSKLPTYGVLTDPSTEIPLKNEGKSLSTTLVPPYDSGIEIQYLPLENYFTSEGPETLSYYVAATEDMESRSKEVSVLLNVINVNDPVEISCPASFYVTLPQEETVHQVTLNNFSILDTDLSMDMVHVVITAERGSLTLNQEFANALDFASGDICFGQEKWTCRGSGSGDSSMSFVGYPSDVLKAIEGMTYVPLETGEVDNVKVTIYDGAGDQCISNQDHEGSAIRTECFSSACSFQVLISPQRSGSDGNDEGNDGNTSEGGGFKMGNIPSYGWVLIFVGITACGCFCVKRVCCHSRVPPPMQGYPPPHPHYMTPLPYAGLQIPNDFATTVKKMKDTPGHPKNDNKFDMNYYDLSEKGRSDETPTECPSPSELSDSPLKKVRSRSSSSLDTA